MADAARSHTATVNIDGSEIRGILDYQVDVGMLDPADAFTITVPHSRSAWDAVKPDRPVRFEIDQVPVLVGFIDSRRYQAKDGTIIVAGRDKVGRLVQESAPKIAYQDRALDALIAELARPWFTKVTFSNARNRNVQRGHGHKVSASNRIFLNAKVGSNVNPGALRWSVIEELCKQAGYLCWSSCDGVELFVGQPEYNQEAQYRIFEAAAGSPRQSTPGLLDIVVEDSVADRYARIIYLGAGAGTDANYGIAVASRAGEARNNTATANGTGKDFSAEKTLIVSDRKDVKSRAEAKKLAEHEMRIRDARGHVITVTHATHGQVVAGTQRTLFVPDTIAHVETEPVGRKGLYLLTACSYRSTREAGETTAITLYPKGADFSP